MEQNVSEIIIAWKQAVDPDVIKATAENWDKYPPLVQGLIEAEARRRGLWEKVLYLRGEKPEYPISSEGHLEGYICESCKQPRTSNTRFTIYTLLIIIASLTFLAISCSFYYIDFTEGLVDELATLTAHATWLGIVFLFLWRGKLRHQKAVAFFWFALILCAIASYRSVRLLNEAGNTQNALREVVSVFDDFIANRQISGDEINEKSYGEMAPFIRLFTDWTSEVQKDSLTMHNEIDKCNLASIFDARTLTEHSLLLQCQSNYEKAGNIFQMYEEIVRNQLNDFPTRIGNSALPDNLKQRALSGFNRDKDETLKDITDSFQVRNRYVSEAKKLLAFMKDKRGYYKYQDNKIIFDFQEDGETFGAYQRSLLSLLKQEESLEEKVQQEGLIKAKELENLLR